MNFLWMPPLLIEYKSFEEDNLTFEYMLYFVIVVFLYFP